jgi:GNAT superfamily N-acetyltransferase
MPRSAPAPIGAHIHPALFPVGNIEDGSTVEIAAAEEWLREAGCTRAQGPMGPTTWHPYRANLGPHDRPPFLGEPTFSPEPWEESGYEITARYASALADNLAQSESAMAASCALVTAGWDIRTLDQHPSFEEALRHFYRITVAAFQQAHAYTDLSWDGFHQMYAPARDLVDPQLVLTAISPEGDAAGFCFCIPDRLNPDLREFVVKTLAVDPKWRRLGLGSWLVGNAHSRAHTAGWTGGGIHALMWTDSHSRQISAHGGQIIREYAMYSKDLSPG